MHNWLSTVRAKLSANTAISRLAIEKNLRRSDIRFALKAFEQYKFDVDAYLKGDRDRRALSNSPIPLLQHYLRHGAEEGRFLHFDCSAEDVLAFHRAACEIDPSLARGLLRCLVASLLHKTGSLLDSDSTIITELRALATTCEFKPYLVIGDSHSTAYSLPFFVSRDYFPIWACCWGGSARGLSNSESKLQYGRRVLAFLEAASLHEDVPLILCFGQVDIEFVHYFNLVNHDPPKTHYHERMIAFIEGTVARYLSFIEPLSRQIPSVNVFAIFPPSLSDNTIRTGYLLSEVGRESSLPIELLRNRLQFLDFPTIAERTALHRHFNKRLGQECRAAGISFFSVYDGLLAPSGVVDERYMHEPLGAEHHLHYNAFSRMLLDEIQKVVGYCTQ